MTHPHIHEHDTASLGAVVAAGLILTGLLVGAAVLVAQVVDLAAWAMVSR
ncbi:hypothetical protein [Cellulomonas edaphi]|uniref:Uncharacterized protein n=1 Tax=Cellulomonas edaphi TaxID=3053468 RepID=A0ABT7S9C6_9CELL|nr:hypothetical protein [Cellulomons edaphi]MDM7832229.1 hypothetical protein [Cellulomons edaphi]